MEEKTKDKSDCISRKAVLQVILDWWECKTECDDISEIIRNLPSIDEQSN